MTGDGTVAFYEREADAYFRSTLKNDLTDLYRLFLECLPEGGLILDAGSGSGRDTLSFLRAGYRVEAFDASARLASLSEEMTGIRVDVARFETWRGAPDRYAGIWCFASLLHVRNAELPAVLDRLVASLKPGGSFFASFKWGERSTVDERGRCFTNLTPDTARELFEGVQGLELTRIWAEGGPTALSDPTTWIYVLGRRRG
ncbi:MAG: class I SAM-dependent methyltransferase [Aurantimonas endophytica]|uniref:class I SAM-dependent methyltransferase n=1 Tax=Aurantimonas endophytica TaxID=1522175 RepID=UPI003001E1B0